MHPITAVCPNFSWNASCANTPVMYILGDFDSKVIAKCITAACRTPRSAAVTCVKMGGDENRSGFKTQRSVRRTWWTLAVADRGDGHGLLLSPTILPFFLFHLCDMSSPSAQRSTGRTFRIVASPLWPPRTSAVKRTKVFDSFAPDDDSPARLLLLTSFLLRAGRARLWHRSPSCHLLGWGVCTRPAEYTRALSPAAALPSPGIMTTWRRRKKFVFLVFALRVLGWSVASEKADNTGPTAQEGKKAIFKTTKMFFIIHWASWCVAVVSADLCGWTDSGINRWRRSFSTGMFYCNTNKPSTLFSYITLMGQLFISLRIAQTPFPTVHSSTLLFGNAHCSRFKDLLRWNNKGKQTDETGKTRRDL